MAGERVIYCKKGAFVTVTVLQGENGYKELRINNIPEAPTDYGCLQAFHVLAHLPCLLHKNPQKSLVLCFGAGITTGAMATHNLQQIDAVEICPDVIEANLYFFKENQYILADNRLNLIIDEGRNYLLNNRNRYDIIACDATHPRSSDSWILYTREFYELCRKRLNPDGIMCQWLPIHGLTPIEYKRIIRTFLIVFPNATLWFINRFTILLGTLKRLTIDFNLFTQRLENERIKDDLKQLNLDDPYAFLSCFMTDNEGLEKYTQGMKISTDHCPLVRHDSQTQLPIDTKPLNLSDLSRIRKNILSFLSNPEKQSSIVKKELNKYFEAKNYVIQGRIFCFNGMLKEEEDSYRKALNMIPEDNDTKYLLEEAEFNLLLAEAKKCVDAAAYNAARKMYKKALNINPGSRAPYYNLGVVYLKMGLYDEALRYFKKTLEIVPWNAETYYNLAITYWRKGMYENCRLELEKALSFNSTMEKAKQALLKLGELQKKV